jgi:hypothetical protein
MKEHLDAAALKGKTVVITGQTAMVSITIQYLTSGQAAPTESV